MTTWLAKTAQRIGTKGHNSFDGEYVYLMNNINITHKYCLFMRVSVLWKNKLDFP